MVGGGSDARRVGPAAAIRALATKHRAATPPRARRRDRRTESRRRGRRAAAAALAALSALWCFRGTAAAATVEGAKTLIEKTASDVGLGEVFESSGYRRATTPRSHFTSYGYGSAPGQTRWFITDPRLPGDRSLPGTVGPELHLVMHQTEILGEFGVVFFLFEMGLELSVAKIGAMRTEIFGLGLAQFLATTAVLAKGAQVVGSAVASPFSTPASIAVGGARALSSSAFVLQLLKDNEIPGLLVAPLH